MILSNSKINGAIASRIGLSRKKLSQPIETVLELIKSTLEAGEHLLSSGFGKFCVKKKRKRKGRNPATGKDMIMAPWRVVTLKWPEKLRNKING